MSEDTIAAIATAQGSAGIAVIRLSGPAALNVADRVFAGRVKLSDVDTHKVCFGRIVEPAPGDTFLKERAAHSTTGPAQPFLDEVVAAVFRAPHSYTGEDVVEIGCHGGQYLSNKILELLICQGARLAEPGEFSKRAFLNGRFDLSQAEAVADIISAKTEMNLRAALSQYRGVFSRHIQDLKKQLIDVCSLLELELDFAEEDVEFAEKKEIAQQLNCAIDNIERFLATFKRGKILREGVKLVIVGKPNVGKSSLLNALLKEDRAIVTDVPGTTRDILEEQINIRGVYFRVVDTAGVRATKGRIEKEGINRTIEQIRNADTVLFLLDGSKQWSRQDTALIEQVFSLRDDSRKNGVVAAINKIDLQRKTTRESVQRKIGVRPTVEISATEFLGLDRLEEVLVNAVLGEKNSPSVDEPLVTNLRQKMALEKAKESLLEALSSLERGLSSEFIALDLRGAMQHLGELIGDVTTEDILGNIFSKFCIGK